VYPKSIPEHQTDLNDKMRTILIEWLDEVRDEYKFQKEVLDLAIQYVDAYINEEQSLISRNTYQLIGICCFMIASCLLSDSEISPREMAYITDHSCTKKEIEICTIRILNVVKGYLY
jgi:hypothetical protein